MMFSQTAQLIRGTTPPHYAVAPQRASHVHALTNEHLAEVLAFLARRPLHTVFLAGLILDNGLVSPLNRGDFHAFRNFRGELEGIALVGHVILIEARTEEAIEAFATLAQNFAKGHIILGEHDKVESFWRYYSEGGQSPRLFARELLFEQRWPVETHEAVPGLRLATVEDLPLLLPVHAQMAFEETGVNPLNVDAEGFRLRMARRIGRGRVWVWIEDGRLIFKADVIAETPQVNYLEGVYVNPEERGRGYGLRCLSQLTRQLLSRTNSVTVLVNEQNQEAANFYLRAGYKLRNCYDTIILKK